MSLEKILGIVLVLVLLIGGLFFLRSSKNDSGREVDLSSLSADATPAPDISTPDQFFNTNDQPITISEFKGKQVVLVDFWTYSCINCQRTLPYLNAWYDKYRDQGLVIIGIHTPEFSFERLPKNVAEAVEKYQIKYPVVMDNDFSTWRAYHNQFWPAKYLVDIDGNIIYSHFGEGSYDETEAVIQAALKQRADRLGLSREALGEVGVKPSDEVAVDFSQVGSPETYFGSDRNEYLANGTPGQTGEQTLTVPANLGSNQLYLGGHWNFEPEYAESLGPAKINFKYRAKNVYMVASAEQPVEMRVYVDDQLLQTVTIQQEELYHLVEGADYGEHTLRLEATTPGLRAFTFTFG